MLLEANNMREEADKKADDYYKEVLKNYHKKLNRQKNYLKALKNKDICLTL